jgi:hypothetical protein
MGRVRCARPQLDLDQERTGRDFLHHEPAEVAAALALVVQSPTAGLFVPSVSL